MNGNHLMLGHLLEWFYTYVGGIRRDDSEANQNGYQILSKSTLLYFL